MVLVGRIELPSQSSEDSILSVELHEQTLEPLARLELAYPLTLSRLGNERDTAANWKSHSESNRNLTDRSRCSIPLSYGTKWWERRDSNPHFTV